MLFTDLLQSALAASAIPILFAGLQVYKARRHEATVVALKVMAAEGATNESDQLSAVQLEALVLQQARHPHIVTCFQSALQVCAACVWGRGKRERGEEERERACICRMYAGPGQNA